MFDHSRGLLNAVMQELDYFSSTAKKADSKSTQNMRELMMKILTNFLEKEESATAIPMIGVNLVSLLPAFFPNNEPLQRFGGKLKNKSAEIASDLERLRSQVEVANSRMNSFNTTFLFKLFKFLKYS